jgi:hypothetical protein
MICEFCKKPIKGKAYTTGIKEIPSPNEGTFQAAMRLVHADKEYIEPICQGCAMKTMEELKAKI